MKLEEMRKLCDAATPGPWYGHEEEPTAIVSASDPDMSLLGLRHGMACIYVEADARFVAAARMLLPKLLAVAEAAKKAIQNGGHTSSLDFGCDPSDIQVLDQALIALEAEP